MVNSKGVEEKEIVEIVGRRQARNRTQGIRPLATSIRGTKHVEIEMSLQHQRLTTNLLCTFD